MAKKVTIEDFEDEVLKNKLPVIVDFYSDSCLACKKLVPTLGEFEDNYEGKIEIVKVNTNFDIELAQEYVVMSNPTLLLFNNGEIAGRKVGAVSYKELEEFASKVLV